jgi:PEP-CTERM motif
MSLRNIFKFGCTAVALFVGGSVQAATVTCPGVLTPSLTRQVSVTGALTGGECYYKAGNFQGDDVSDYLGTAYAEIDKDIAGPGASFDNSEGGLRYSTTSGDRNAGTWGMASDYWNTYAEVFIGFHFGNGSGNPDSFIVELDPNALSGTWALLPTNLANGLSNIYLWGRGTCTVDCGGGPTGDPVPEPATLALVGLGLFAAAATRRRQLR